MCQSALNMRANMEQGSCACHIIISQPGLYKGKLRCCPLQCTKAAIALKLASLQYGLALPEGMPLMRTSCHPLLNAEGFLGLLQKAIVRSMARRQSILSPMSIAIGLTNKAVAAWKEGTTNEEHQTFMGYTKRIQPLHGLQHCQCFYTELVNCVLSAGNREGSCPSTKAMPPRGRSDCPQRQPPASQLVFGSMISSKDIADAVQALVMPNGLNDLQRPAALSRLVTPDTSAQPMAQRPLQLSHE